MSDERGPWHARPVARTSAVLALLAYLPALTAAPGRMPSDSKLYLYLDPGRFIADAAATFDGRQFAGWVPHQHIAYVWPTAPWFWLFETLGVPDWIAHRLWIGSIMLAAGLGVRWCARLLGLGAMAAFAAAITYQLSLYVLPYVSRTSVMLLPWAGLGWIVAFTIRATRRRNWADPAAIALVVLTVGAVNATALAMIIPAPTWWILHAAWRRSIAWRDALLVTVRVGVLSAAVSIWWIVMLLIQGRFGTDVLPYSESLADVSLTATSPETWRGLGYWLFYVRDPYAATTTESLRYLTSSFSIAVSYALPIAGLVALTWCRWIHRRFAAGLLGIGLVLAVGVHPIDERSPLMRVVAGDDDGGLALALRSSTRALPVMMLGLALALAMAVEAGRGAALPRLNLRVSSALAAAVALVAVVNLPALWTGGFVDPALERDQDPPRSWLDAAAALDATGDAGRVLQLPGAEFGAYRWGYAVDQPLPGLTDKPLVTRDLLPLGSGPAMDLVYALDDRVQDGVLEPESLAPVSRLLGVDTIWLTNDIAFERFRTARPDIVRDLVVDAPGTGAVSAYGEPSPHSPEIPTTDERVIGDPRVGGPAPDVELVPIDRPGRIVRAAADVLVVSGSGDGLVDAAAAGLLDGTDTVVRYSADLGRRAGQVIDQAAAVIVTDSNRDRARHWRGSQDTTGFTERGGPGPGLLQPVASDARLDLFATSDPSTQTVAVQRGPVVATATGYGEPFAYLPERRPFMAVDGDLATAWLVGEHGDPVGETLRLEFERGIDRFVLHQPMRPNDRHITRLSYRGDQPDVSGTVALDDASWSGPGIELRLAGPVTSIDLTIEAVAGGTPFTASAVAPVGFTEVMTELGPASEIVRPPVDATDHIDADAPLAYVLTRLRVDPMDRWRDDPEPTLVREIDLATDRDMAVVLTGRIDARATDRELASLFGWPAAASTRLTGSLRNPGVAALDGDDDTAWITAFGAAIGATLSTTAAEPITTIEVRQPQAGFSTATALTVRAAGEERVVRLEPDAAGTATAVIEPPLPSGPVEFVLSEVDEVVTTDRRFGDPVTLPASISELRFDGQPSVEPLDTAGVALSCTTVAEIDGVAVAATIDVDGAGWLDGQPIELEPCAPGVQLGAGRHLIEGSVGSVPITLDRVVLDDGVRAALDDLPPAPAVDVDSVGRFDRTVRVGPCPDGCWLVLGEGVNEAWSASGPEGDLGAPVTVDGGFNGWWIEPGPGTTVVELRWTAQRALDWALVLSALGAVAAICLIVRERVRRELDDTPSRVIAAVPTWSWGPAAPVGRRHALVLTAVWAIASGLLAGPQWALCGLVGGAAIALIRRRHRLVELTALASLMVVAAVVVVRERRTAPLPNGGWPGTFDSLHGLGMFAVACVIVAALTADDPVAVDADTDRTEDPPGRVTATPAGPRTGPDARHGCTTRMHDGSLPSAPMIELLRRRPVRVGASVAVLPLIVAVIVLLGRPWAPVLDLAMTEFRIRDVGGRHTPRIGLPGRIGRFPDQGSHPGPWSFYLVAPIYRLAGATAWGMQLGSVVVNSAAFVGVIAIGRRTVGSVGAVAMAAVVAVAIRGFGPNVLTHPWNPYFPLAIWLLLLVAAWAVVAGDHRLAVVVAVCASLAAQTHVPYLVSCVVVSLVVLASLVRTWLMTDGDERVGVRRSTLVALGVTAVMWMPPVVDELRRNPGNMTMLWRHFTGEPDEPVVPLATAIKLFLRHLDVFGAGWSLLTDADGFVSRSGVPVETAGAGSVVAGFVVLLVWIVSALIAFRMHEYVLNALNVVLAAALTAGLVSMTRILGKVWFYLTLWSWMTLLLVVVSVLWTAVVVIRHRVELSDDRLRYAAAGVVAVMTTLSLGAVAVQEVPERTQSDGLRAVVTPTVGAIEAGLGAAVGRDGTYLVVWQDALYIGAQGYGLVNELERRGIDVGVREPWRVPVTPHRVLPPGSFDAEVHLVSGPYVDEWRAREGFVEVVEVDIRTSDERARFEELRTRVALRLDELDRNDLADAVERNLFGASLDPDLPRDVVDDLAEMLLLGAPLAVFIAPPGSTG